jgi:hypothetical protein
MSIDVVCPGCGAKLKLPEKFAGRGLVCPKCQHEFRLSSIPAPAASSQRQRDAASLQKVPPPPTAPPRPIVSPRPEKQPATPQSSATAKQDPPRPQTRPAGAPASRIAPIIRAPKPPTNDFWDQADDLDPDVRALHPRQEPRKLEKNRKPRTSKRPAGKSDWPYYVFGLVCFGPLTLLTHGLLIWSLLAGHSAAASKAQSPAAAQGAGAASDAPAGGGPVAPGVDGGSIPNNGVGEPKQQPADGGVVAEDADDANPAPATVVQPRRKIPGPRGNPDPLAAAQPPEGMPPAFPPAGQFPNNGNRRFPRGPNRAAEMRRLHDEWMKAARERAAEAQKRMMADNRARQQAGAGGNGQPVILEEMNPNDAGQPIIADPAADHQANLRRVNRRRAKPVQAAPDPAANPDLAINPGQGANAAPAAQAAAAPTATADSQNPLPLDAYLSRGSQGILALVLTLWYLVMVVYLAAGVGATFAKAGRPGWAVIIPVYNVVTLFNIAEISAWWCFLVFVPFLNLLIVLWVAICVAEKFGKSSAFGVGLAFLGPVFYPVLGFGSARYKPYRTKFASESY